MGHPVVATMAAFLFILLFSKIDFDLEYVVLYRLEIRTPHVLPYSSLLYILAALSLKLV